MTDCFGPLPKTKKGRQYLLTIMRATTRFPEAIPLSNVNAKTIVSSLMTITTWHGIPRTIQSDSRTNFTSHLFGKIMDGLGMAQYLSTAFHPESQGALRRFHQTLKSLLKWLLCGERKWLGWRFGLFFFAIRDSKSKSMWFSPFQLLHERKIHGSLNVFNEAWINQKI